jgi:mevalonate pyrophosphate decarboxylase
MAVYNGNDGIPAWTPVDDNGTNGINKNVAQSAVAPQLTVLGSKLYATWVESKGTANQIRMAVYNGNDGVPAWTFVDGGGTDGINKNVAQYADVPQLTVLGSKLYATWYESNGTAYQIRTAVYNGNDAASAWAFVDGGGTNGINKNVARPAYAPQLTVLGSKLYSTWYEYNGTANQIRIAVGQ